jgi:tRNA(fMet)-specific endonuclease VapC
MAFIDTSVVIAFLAGDEKTVALVKEFAEKEDMKTTTITEYELLKHKTALKRELAEEFLSEITVCPFDRASARKAASIYEKLRETGNMINESDLLIAGIALAADEVLLTRDQKFGKIKDAKIQIV